jgi:hypothetical protein
LIDEPPKIFLFPSNNINIGHHFTNVTSLR